MPEARPCPHCGAPIEVEVVTRVEDPAHPASDEPENQAEIEEDLDRPTVPLLAPGSQDDDFFGLSSSSRIVPTEPDPILGPFVTPASTSAPSTLIEDPAESTAGPPFPAIDFGSGVETRASSAPTKVGRDQHEETEDEDEDDEVGTRGTSWTTVLLASYASAITLGLGWTLMRDRPRETPQPASTRPNGSTLPESARQAGLSRKVEPPEPILGEHFAKMDRPLRVGDLEVTPVDVRRLAITLERSALYAKPDRKAGGKGALVLRLKLKNVSNDAVFAPLDQAYVRERGKEIVDTFIETADGERIYPYPLAIESEWSIVGQDFGELRPGESRVVVIASAPEAPADSLGPFIWRVRLRTGINRTDVIGLRWPE